MANSKKLMIDSCVTFRMLTYDKCNRIYGKEIVNEIIEKRKQKLEQLEKDITASFDEKFNNNFAHLSFADKILIYKNYISREIGEVNKKIVSKYFLAKGIEVKRDKKTDKLIYNKNDHLPQETRDDAKEQYIILKSFLRKYKKYSKKEKFNLHNKDVNNEYLIRDVVKYKELRDQISAGELYLKMLEGEYEFYIPSVSLKEIENHTKDKEEIQSNASNQKTQNDKKEGKQNNNPQEDDDEQEEENERGWLKVKEEDIKNFINNKDVRITYSLDENTNNLIEALAGKYRERSKDSNAKEMAKDINSANEFGDSKIMAMASIAGMPLATFNCKDFIFDKNLYVQDIKGKDYKINHNEKIRQHIANVNSGEDIATDAYAYSVDEILNGTYHTPTKECQVDFIKNENIPFYKDLSDLLDIVGVEKKEKINQPPKTEKENSQDLKEEKAGDSIVKTENKVYYKAEAKESSIVNTEEKCDLNKEIENVECEMCAS